MAGVFLELNRGDLVELSAKLRGLSAAGIDFSVPFQAIGEDLIASHHIRFDKQQSPDGERWKKLSEEYRQSKRKRESRGANKILVLDGYLRDLLRYIVSDKVLQFGTDRVYGARHQFDRPWLGFSQQDKDDAAKTLSGYLSSLING